MRPVLLLRLPSAPASAIAWLACDDGQPVARGSDALNEAAAHAGGRRIVALVPGDSVLLTRVAVPSRKPHHIRQAVPFLLEEQLAADVASLHFAIGPRTADGSVAVAVVDRALLTQWLATLVEAGLDPDVLLPEPLALPDPGANWVLAGDDTRLLLRSGPLAGCALDRDALPQLLRAALAEAAVAPASITLCGVAAAELEACGDGLPELRVSSAPDLATLLARHAADGPDPLDLRQGPFARFQERQVAWRDWRRPLLLAVCLLLLLFGQRGWQVQQLERESARLQAELAATLQATFPDITRVVDPEAQMRQRLEQLRSAGGDDRFLELLAAAADALAEEPGWQLAGLSYQEGALRLQLRMPDFDHFERLRGRFAARTGVVAEVGSLGSVDGAVRGSVTVRGAGA